MDYYSLLLNWAHNAQRLDEEPTELLYALTGELNRLGMDLGLASIAIRTPHPQLDMLVIRWRPLAVEEVPTNSTVSIVGKTTTTRTDGVQDIFPLAHGHTDEAMWINSPFHKALESKKSLRIRLAPPPTTAAFPIVDDLVARGMTDYAVFPLKSPSGVSVVVSITTMRNGGYPDDFIEAFNRAIPALSLSIAYKVERIQFRQVLAAYIGTEPAERVLDGQIRRGDLVTREAALGFADLRGFTAASETLDSSVFLEMIGTFFELVCDAITQVGGEVLKFMGDGVLFIVPDEGDAQTTCNRALQAVETLMHAIGTHNKNMTSEPLRFGCALHYGSVLYGNIGAPSRLDFTVLGPAVNLTSRLESLSGSIDEVCLLSERFAQLTTRQTRSVGAFNLKGFTIPHNVYAPSQAPHESGK